MRDVIVRRSHWPLSLEILCYWDLCIRSTSQTGNESCSVPVLHEDFFPLNVLFVHIRSVTLRIFGRRRDVTMTYLLPNDYIPSVKQLEDKSISEAFLNACLLKDCTPSLHIGVIIPSRIYCDEVLTETIRRKMEKQK